MSIHSTSEDFIKINDKDNVAVALHDIKKGSVSGFGCVAGEDIVAGHKMAIKDIAKGESVIKYGFPIGCATEDIKAGFHVHTHNLSTLITDKIAYQYDEAKSKASYIEWQNRVEKAKGGVPNVYVYKRANGSVGARNEIWILPLVGCVNNICEKLERWGMETFCAGKARDYTTGGIEGIYAFKHPYGCSQMGGDKENTAKILASLSHNPNAGGVLIVSLGCEENNIDYFTQFLGSYDRERVKFMVCQECSDEVEEGKKLLSEIASIVEKDRRTPAPLSDIVIGFKCGGSDGMSGITANALIGQVCNAFTDYGGKAILTEVPEMFGAETILMERCKDRATFEATVKLIEDFKGYYKKHGQVCYENPSPGNKAGGISTLEDKSLGCVQKGGKAVVTDVLRYGGHIKEAGLSLLEGPGNDIVSTTALVAAGANVILFSTGRGTPLGAAVPTIKIATNHALTKNKSDWIDFDASSLLEMDKKEVCASLMRLICDIVSGKKITQNEYNGYREIAIFKDGVTL